MTTVIGRKRTLQESNAELDDSVQMDTPMADASAENSAQSAAAANGVAGAVASSSHGKQSDFSPQFLQVYYDRLFPYQDVFNWLSYFNDPTRKHPSVNGKHWKNREFSFTLKDDIYIRFKSYGNLQDFRDDIRKKCPYKIDIGASYNVEPSRKQTISSDKFIPEEKEFVIDIDISDYDDVRTCCQGADICTKCWGLMACAIGIIERALRDDFGFEHLCWVFSGRRGIHCWVSDELPRKFDSSARTAVIDYLKLYSGNPNNAIKVDLSKETSYFIHDSLRRAYEICKGYFKRCSLDEQRILDTESGLESFLSMVRSVAAQNELRANLQDASVLSGDEQWETIKNIFEAIKLKQKDNSRVRRQLDVNLMEIVFAYVYPRLDVEVSRHMNHLLKCPFVIHPKTGKVCTIIDPQKCDSFNPLKQPTLATLMDELEKVDPAKKILWRETSMKSVVETFRTTFLNGLEEENTKKFKL